MEELILKLKENNIGIKLINGEIKASVPKGFENNSLIQEIRNHKEELKDFIIRRKSNNSIAVSIPKNKDKEYFKLTSPQLRIFISERLVKNSTVYNLPQVYKINGKLDVEKISKIFTSLIQRHESLRTSFTLDSKYEPIQKVLTEFDFEIEQYTNEKSDLDSIIQKFIRPFDLEKAPLFRAGIITLSRESQIMLIDLHHIISDGTSQEILIHDFFQLYNGMNLPEIDIEYTDYIDWYFSEEFQKNLEFQKKFWLDEFEGTRPQMEIPSDYSRPREKSFRGGVLRFSLDQKRSKELNQIALKNNVSLFTILSSVFSILLSKLSNNNEDVIIGTPSAGRKHSDLRQIIGCFVNILALRMFPKNNLTFKNYISQTGEKLLSCFDNQDYPFEQLIDDLKINRDPAYNPLFNIVFILQNIEKKISLTEGLDIDHYQYQIDNVSKFDLSLYAFEKEEGIDFEFKYALDLFNADTIEKFSSYFQHIIVQILENENILISDISTLPIDQELALIELVNGNEDVNYAKNTTIIDLFEQQVEKSPNATALVCQDASVTYKELNNRSNQLAHKLRSHGVGRESIVGLFVDKNISVIIGMLGILKAGGCYLPIDTTYPKGRVDYILEDSKIDFLITKSSAEIIGNNCKSILIDDIEDGNGDASNPIRVNTSEDLCYIIYTSGTTGKPKGVMVEHKNIVQLFFNDSFQFKFGENNVWTMFHSHCFDFSVWEMYGALLFGGKLILVSPSDARDPWRYLKILKDNKVTVLNQTPTAFYNLIEVCDQDDVLLSELRYVIFGGEALTPSKLKLWSKNHPKVKLINMFGITETTVHVTYKEIGTNEMEQKASNIGRSLPTSYIYLLDKGKNLVPKGAVGEIYVGGLGVTRGYLNKQKLTNEKFITNPYKTDEKIYKSGDLGRVLPNGEIEYLGRLDHQVQLSGFRIELGEIEYHLAKHEAIDTAIVIKRESYLCAYVHGKEKIKVEGLRDYLSKKLPAYMIPLYFIQIENIPFTSNNKIAKDKLPLPGSEISNNYIAPRNNKEQYMSEIWGDILNLEKVGVTDNYFSLGGDSLKAIGLVFEINKKLKSSLTIADLYSHQTIKELVSIASQKEDKENEQLVEQVAQELLDFQEEYKKTNDFSDLYEEVYPMNGVEKGMVFHSMKKASDNIHNITYHEQNLYDFPFKDFDFDLFKRALDLMIDKHNELRKIYDIERFAHIIKKEIDPEVYLIDITSLPKDEQEEFIKKKMEEEKVKATSFCFSVLWRMNIIKVRDDYQYLLFDFHHSLFDGWSLSSFITELNNFYMDLNKGIEYMPKMLNCSYKDQILGELLAMRQESSVQYWKKELEGYNRLQLPKTGLKHEYRSDIYNLGKEYREKLESVAEKYNTSFKHLCFAAYVYSMRMLNYNNDVTIGMVTNNRPLVSDGEQLLGCFLNTIPFRAHVPEELTWGGFIEYIEEKLRVLKHHERMPFYEVLDIIGEVTSENNPVFDVSFSYINFRVFKELKKEQQLEIVEDTTTLTKNYMNNNTLLDFHILAHNEDFKLALTYSTTIVDDELSIKLSIYFKNVLDQFIVNAEEVMTKDSILTKEEKENLTRDVISADTAYPEVFTLVKLFEKQVLQTPNNIAITYEESTLTYEELNKRSNKLAHELRSQGVERNTIVGLLTDKNIDAIIGMLGILKAGGCYLPIDAAYPQERINYIIEDSKVEIIVTDIESRIVINNHSRLVLIKEIYKGNGNTSNLAHINTPEDLCYIIYTSGTTGTPKGVMVEHKNVVRLLFNDDFQFKFGEEDVWTMFHSHWFDFSVWEMYGALLYGGKLIMISPIETRDSSKFLKTLYDNNVTVLNQTPTAFYNLISVCEQEEVILPNLRYVIFGGEALTPSKLKSWHKRHPKVKLVNMYGITETTVHVTYKEIEEYEIEQNVSNIGKSIPTTSIYLFDSNMKLVPQGVIGELCVGGEGVTRGYLNKETLTKERFIPNPYNNEERLYRSGDLARLLKNGEMEYIGRMDNQVQLRGFRIELGEIESVLFRYSMVKESVVLLKGDEDNKNLVCYYVSVKELSIVSLRSHLKKYLPDYMIPSYFVKLNEIPLTSNGKLDRSSLPEPEVTRLVSHVNPSNEIEELLLGIWSDILDIEKDKISVNTSFFSIGGHSLKAMTLISSILKVFHVEISIREVFVKQTIKEISDYIITINQTKTDLKDNEENVKLLIK